MPTVSEATPISFGQAAQRRVRPGGRDRGEPVGGCGIPASAGTVHTQAVWTAQPSTGGREWTPGPVYSRGRAARAALLVILRRESPVLSPAPLDDLTVAVYAEPGLSIFAICPTFAMSRDVPRYPWTVSRRSRMAFFTLKEVHHADRNQPYHRRSVPR